MKYLKTYNKLFESNSRELTLKSESDWNLVNDSIQILHIKYKTKTLHKLPYSLNELNCFEIGLEELPDLPKGLKKLYCTENKLTKLPELPKHLEMLICSGNKLEKLPKLPEKLIKLRCSYNNLKELPELPKQLFSLYCTDNFLTELPELPDSLQHCNIEYNPLERLPKGISLYLLKQNKHDWIKENIFKWLKNEPEDYNILKNYLTKAQQEYFKENGIEGIEDLTQFGLFGLKNDK